MLVVSLVLLASLAVPAASAQQSNDHLYVSAESNTFGNSFAGSVIVEVIVRDPLKQDISQRVGEPEVTVDERRLKMVQGTDGNWYAYFADVDAALAADGIAGGAPGEGLDFGMFCGPATNMTVLGMDISRTEGVAVSGMGLAGPLGGGGDIPPCTEPFVPSQASNVVRNPRSIVDNGQLEPGAWPIVQLFSLDDDVEVWYGRHTGAETVSLRYGSVTGISMVFDRESYPAGAEVILEVSDAQLNQDPTSRDSWSFGVSRPQATFYMAFDEDGNRAADGGRGLVNLADSLPRLGFEDNGVLSMDENPVIVLKTNDHQPATSVTDGSAVYRDIVTLLETRPNSGVFSSYGSKMSVIGTASDAPRNNVANFEYNDENTSVLSGTSPASLEVVSTLRPGTSIPVRITDVDQNTDSQRRDTLDVFRSSAIIPTMRLESPVTLASASDACLYTSADSHAPSLCTSADSYSPSLGLDRNSDRLLVDSRRAPDGFVFDTLSLRLGVSAEGLVDSLIDVREPRSRGTNWFNYDLRSLAQLGLDLSQTAARLYAGLDDGSPVTVLERDGSSGQGLVRIQDGAVAELAPKSGDLYLVFDFDSQGNGIRGVISNETDVQPIVSDFFSFGIKDSESVGSAIYRFELEETETDSSVFAGTIEYTVPNQLNVDDPDLIRSLRVIDEDVRFLATGRVSADDIRITYQDAQGSGTVQQSISAFDGPPPDVTHSGSVSLDGAPFRFGRDVVVRLYDPDLNTGPDSIEVYRVVNDPASQFVDTVGDTRGGLLLDVLLKGVRYQRCAVAGEAHGGLGSTNFALVETAPDSGTFEGRFKLPTWICNEAGTGLMSTAGGSVVAFYHDYQDDSGRPNIFTTKTASAERAVPMPRLDALELEVPPPWQSATNTIRGVIPDYRRGTVVDVTVTDPAGLAQTWHVLPSGQGAYQAPVAIGPGAAPGTYMVTVRYLDAVIGELSFDVTEERMPSWMRDLAGQWAQDRASDDEFAAGIGYLIEKGVLPESPQDGAQQVPRWVKQVASWWAQGDITDDEFVGSLQFLIASGVVRV